MKSDLNTRVDRSQISLKAFSLRLKMNLFRKVHSGSLYSHHWIVYFQELKTHGWEWIGCTRLRNMAVSWLPLILIIREHNSSICVVLQWEEQTAAHPVLSLTDARIREMKIQILKGIYYSLILWEMDAPHVEGGQYKSIPVLLTVMVSVTWYVKLFLKTTVTNRGFVIYFHFCSPCANS